MKNLKKGTEAFQLPLFSSSLLSWGCASILEYHSDQDRHQEMSHDLNVTLVTNKFAFVHFVNNFSGETVMSLCLQDHL